MRTRSVRYWTQDHLTLYLNPISLHTNNGNMIRYIPTRCFKILPKLLTVQLGQTEPHYTMLLFYLTPSTSHSLHIRSHMSQSQCQIPVPLHTIHWKNYKFPVHHPELLRTFCYSIPLWKLNTVLLHTPHKNPIYKYVKISRTTGSLLDNDRTFTRTMSRKIYSLT